MNVVEPYLTITRMTGISNTISVPQVSCLNHVVQVLSKSQCRTRDMIPSNFIGFHPKVYRAIYFLTKSSILNNKAKALYFLDILYTKLCFNFQLEIVSVRHR